MYVQLEMCSVELYFWMILVSSCVSSIYRGGHSMHRTDHTVFTFTLFKSIVEMLIKCKISSFWGYITLPKALPPHPIHMVHQF